MKGLLLFLVLLVAVGISSCKKGCTDRTAANYDPSAKSEKGNCVYDGSVVFWYDSLKSSGSIHVEMADGTQGNTTFDVSGATPDCGLPRYFTYTAAPGAYGYTATLTDHIRGNKADTGTVTISSQQCADWDIPF
jgi:hypothetical protein